ncbi:DUF2073 domain-containing protein [Candidatus Woesearchaeota archaeon]|jgi:hypothetical protein|nr:DUF2073 domain-containing protein [Candidatus Woesearchaeota archaeon]MBT6735177.1 DUF2073 domain-containing protein [Candidatus Woesearchaeota archaeon]MBT7169812.1 DUF2073 domain-containing protein [Candidatus Woesearchaeota archaeon]MBT7474939.1 DUF2073 domain-containing protein [Candidatus Woesearchaeota archaeon]
MLSFQYLPHREYSGLTTDEKLKKVFRIVKKDKIVLMQGRLKPHEEAQLIERTMGQITKNFSGISFCTILPEQTGKGKKNKDEKKVPMMLKSAFYNAFLRNRDTLTIIGPANLVKEIRKNPNRIDLMMD